MNIAVIIAGGSGQRMKQDIPKQFLHVDDKPILIYTLEVFQQNPSVDKIVVVTIPGWQSMIEAYAKQFGIAKLEAVIEGGATRFESVRNGIACLKDVASPDDLLLLHDGNRPLLSDDIINDGIAVAAATGSAVATSPCLDTMYVAPDPRRAEGTVTRETLYKGQSPETVRYSKAVELYQQADQRGLKDLTIGTLLLAMGEKINMSRGAEKNIKITTPEDVEIFKALLCTRKPSWMK